MRATPYALKKPLSLWLRHNKPFGQLLAYAANFAAFS
jgi:hypothetical protein